MFINIRTILSKMQDHNLTTGNIQNLVRKIAIPASIGFFFHTMYNVVDTYFAGLIATTALAALSVSFPVFFIIIALSSGVGTGATALIAHALGGKDNLKAKHYAAQAATFSVLVGIGVTIVGLLISPFLFRLLGAEGEYLQIALDYMNIIFYGSDLKKRADGKILRLLKHHFDQRPRVPFLSKRKTICRSNKNRDTSIQRGNYDDSCGVSTS